jgi:hypothetical protein
METDGTPPPHLMNQVAGIIEHKEITFKKENAPLGGKATATSDVLSALGTPGKILASTPGA